MKTKIEINVYNDLAVYLGESFDASRFIYNECLRVSFDSVYRNNSVSTLRELKNLVLRLRDKNKVLRRVPLATLNEVARKSSFEFREWSFRNGKRPEHKYGGDFVDLLYKGDYKIRRFAGGLGVTLTAYHNEIIVEGVDLEPAEIKSVEVTVGHESSGDLPIRRYYMIFETLSEDDSII